ncbi:MAG: hypothetical protein WCV62_01515 [Candidatus Peribacteraceae bacterium]|jgi:hypothetical protein
MSDIFEQRQQYSRETLERFREKAAKSLIDFGQEFALAVTGSIAKDKLTTDSDLDVLMMTCNIGEQTKEQIRQCICEDVPLVGHPLELYAIAPEEEWKWLICHSELIASDVHFSKFVAGNRALYDRILTFALQPENDQENQRSYFTYNWLYRTRQLRKEEIHDSLKYRPGGLRDVQTLDWVSRRLLRSSETHPGNQLNEMCSQGLIPAKDTEVLARQYGDLLASKMDSRCYVDHETSMNAWVIIEQLRERILRVIGETVGKGWEEEILETVRGDHRNTWNVRNAFDDTSHLLCEIWDSASISQLHNAYRTSYEEWSVRAALALNPHTPQNLRSSLARLSFADMADIHKFLRANHVS